MSPSEFNQIYKSLSLGEQELIDAICVEFERAWQKGEVDRIEDRISKVDESVRDALFLELLLIELHHRRDQGQLPNQADYQTRFPNHADTIHHAFSVHESIETTPSQEPVIDVESLQKLFPDRYRPVKELGRGGMGVIWQIVDERFDRSLAIKVLLPNLNQNEQARMRLDREALITGALQHPGIPPVVDRGSLDNGTPYFTMKLVEGDTLADLLKQKQARSKLQPSSDLQALLDTFEQVCQAVGYAHAKGIVHRDLKPHNVMVGAFGEVQVMDWGMAKVLDASKSVDEKVGSGQASSAHEVASPNQTSRWSTIQIALPTSFDKIHEVIDTDSSSHRDELQSSPDGTRAGALLGTISYMPPEQAKGEQEKVDFRSDVFSLGAILTEILTGEPPYVGEFFEVLEKAQQATLESAYQRLRSCGADPQLIEIALRCLTSDPEKRLVNASEVAAEITQYKMDLQERLKKTELERAKAETAALGERKAKRLVISIGVLLLTLLATAGWFAAWAAKDTQEKAFQQRQTASEFSSTLTEFRRLADDSNWDEANATLERLSGLESTLKDEQLQQEYRQAKDNLNVARDLERIRLEISQIGQTEDWYDKLASEYEEAFESLSINVKSESLQESIDRVRRSDICNTIVVALIHWGMMLEASDPQAEAERIELGKRVLKIAEGAVDETLAESIRIIREREAVPVEQIREFVKSNDLDEIEIAIVVLLAEGLALRGETDAAAELYQELTQRAPDDFWVQNDAGVFYAAIVRPEPWELATRHLIAAHALFPEAAVVLINLSYVLERAGEYDLAIQYAQRAIEIDPNSAIAYAKLGNAFCSKGDLRNALKYASEAVEVDNQSSEAHQALGRIYLMRGDVRNSAKSLQIANELTPGDPRILGNLGGALVHFKPKEAMPILRDAIEGFQEQGAHDVDIAIALTNIGSGHTILKEYEEAEAIYKEAIEVSPTLPEAHYGLGNVYFEVERLVEAKVAFEEAIRLRPGYPQAKWNLTLVKGLLLIGGDK